MLITAFYSVTVTVSLGSIPLPMGIWVAFGLGPS